MDICGTIKYRDVSDSEDTLSCIKLPSRMTWSSCTSILIALMYEYKFRILQLVNRNAFDGRMCAVESEIEGSQFCVETCTSSTKPNLVRVRNATRSVQKQMTGMFSV